MRSAPRLYRFFSFLLIASFFVGACNLLSLDRETEEPPLATEEGGEVEATKSIEPTALPAPTEEPPALPFTLSQGPRFGTYAETASEVIPMMTQEAIAGDLSNVRIPYTLSKAQLERLAKDGFVVSPGVEKEFFTVYEKARYDNLPIFVTSDAMLHVYHLMFSKVLRSAETQHFIPLLRDMNQALLAKADEAYQSLQSGSWEDPARRTVAFFGVGSRLLDSNVQVPAYAADLVQAELALIDQAAGIQPSPIFSGLEYGEDYTQYIPRGHYTKSEALKAYFKSMMWYGRMTFRLKGNNPETGKAETRSALLVVYVLRNAQVNGRPALDAWADLYAPTVFFVGRSDDLTATQYGDVIDHIYGQGASLETLADESRLGEFIDLAMKLPPPKILGMVIQDSDDEEQMTKGLRFMGQRFVPDAYIFRQLIYRNVGTQSHRRGLPKGLDLLAAMGSERSYQILEQMGETSYENYPTQMDKVKTWLSGLGTPDWTETLYNAWLYSFYPLLEKPGEGYPAFMRSQVWQDKQINTTLGSWTELKHDTILYAKQVYAELGGGPPPPPPIPPKGYVEPVPLFFARLSALTGMTRTGLSERGLLSDADLQGLTKLEDLANSLQAMAGKELRGEPLTDQEYERIRFIGGELENLTMLAAEPESGEAGDAPLMMDEQQAALVADVATDPDPGDRKPVVLEEAVGRINEIYVVTPILEADGSAYLQAAKGGVFSYYEFPWPADDRLTDEKWQKMLDDGQAPALPDWTKSFFIAETDYANVGRSIFRFQSNVIYLYWDPQNANYNLAELEKPLFETQLNDLVSQKQYMGHQLISTDIRSFDLQSATLAVATVRETWLDKLYTFSGDWPNYDEQPIKQRGPYTLDVTYTLEYIQGEYQAYWKVTHVVYANQPPDW